MQSADPFPSSPQQAQEAVLGLVGEAQYLLSLIRAMITSGQRIRLAGLESAIGLLCAKALDLPPDQAAPVRAQLTLLLAELDRLTLAVRGEPP